MFDKVYYMQKAIEEAYKAYDLLEVPVGAVIVKDNTIIGTGYNMKESRKDPVSHAEIEAIHNACKTIGDWRLNNCQLYVTAELTII